MIAIEIASYLAAEGLGTVNLTGAANAQATIFVGTLPAMPDECIALFPTGGQYSPSGESIDEPTVQIIVRGTQNPQPAAELAQQIYDTLHGFRSGTFVTGGTYVVSCYGMQSGPTWIGRDENKRHEYSLNFQLRIQNKNRRA
jgi:hypothetical protein